MNILSLHNQSNRLYRIWKWIKTRCNNKNQDSYESYWGRWITYDKKWEKFENFYKDMKKWYKEHLTIDRKDNDLGYNKDNCRWATRKQQVRNRRDNIKYRWINVIEICKNRWLNYSKIRVRIHRWWSIEKALEINN